MSTELQGKREKLVHDAREALEEIKKNTDESRATELEQRHDTIMGELDKIDAAIEREARVAKAEARSEELRASKRPQPRDGEERTSSEAPEYREVFHKFLRSGAEMDALTSEERKVLRTGAPQDGAEFRVQTAGTNSAGGYTVPVELMNEIVKSMAATGPMYDANIVRELNTSSGNQINIPTVDDTAGTASLHTEAAALTDDNSADATLGQKRLDAYVYDTKFVRWSMELGQDSIFNVEALLGELLGERLGRKANSILTTGTGSSQPNGIVTAASSGVTAAAVAAITCDELLDLAHSVDPAYRGSPKARFMFNDGTLKAIRKLKDGNGQYIWQMGNIQQGAPAQLLGYAYSVNQAMASLATGNKTVLFGDFGKYIVRKVGGPVLGVMRERFWPDLGIAGLIRLDGELVDTAAVKYLVQA
jgi:HK97 family phage major capsid protein